MQPLHRSSSQRRAAPAPLRRRAAPRAASPALASPLAHLVARPLRLLWRNFWLVSATAVLLCAIFAAQAAAHLVEASLAPMAPSPDAAGPSAPRPAAAPLPAAPAVPVAVAPAGVAMPRPVLALLATHVSDDPRRSFASLVEPATRFSGGYVVGDRIPGGGVLAAVHYQYVEIDYAGRLERLAFTSDAPTAPSAPPAPGDAPPVDSSKLSDEERALLEGIRQAGEHHYEVDRALVEQVMANPMAFLKRVRAVPAVVDGQAVGFKLYGVTPTSMPARFGLSSGDTLQAINGIALTSASAALDAYGQLRAATSLELTLTRRGKPLTLKVSIR
jgi:general secretion pathway protein C